MDLTRSELKTDTGILVGQWNYKVFVGKELTTLFSDRLLFRSQLLHNTTFPLTTYLRSTFRAQFANKTEFAVFN